MDIPFDLDPLWASVFVTVVLALITFWQMMEARKLRLESVKPALSLEPGQYLISGGFMFLYLVNDGGTARDVKIDISYDGSKESLFAPSISRNEKWLIIQNAAGLYEKGTQINVYVKYKDTYGKNHLQNLSVDFGKLKKEKRPIPYVLSSFDIISNKLADIERQLKEIEQRLRK